MKKNDANEAYAERQTDAVTSLNTDQPHSAAAKTTDAISVLMIPVSYVIGFMGAMVGDLKTTARGMEGKVFGTDTRIVQVYGTLLARRAESLPTILEALIRGTHNNSKAISGKDDHHAKWSGIAPRVDALRGVLLNEGGLYQAILANCAILTIPKSGMPRWNTAHDHWSVLNTYWGKVKGDDNLPFAYLDTIMLSDYVNPNVEIGGVPADEAYKGKSLLDWVTAPMEPHHYAPNVRGDVVADLTEGTSAFLEALK